MLMLIFVSLFMTSGPLLQRVKLLKIYRTPRDDDA
jgi:hypothetical protein